MEITEAEMSEEQPSDDDDEEIDYDERLAKLSSEILYLLNKCVASATP